MKKTLLIIMTLAALVAPMNAFAAETAPQPAKITQKAAALKKAGVPVDDKDPNKVIVIVNGVEMTQSEARLVILKNIKNHKQMTPEEMTAYVNNLEANANNK